MTFSLIFIFSFDPEARPEIANLLRIYSACSGRSIDELCTEHSASSNAVFKDALTQAVWTKIGPVSNEIARLRTEPEFVQHVLKQGAERAREVSAETMKHIRQVIGLE